MRKFVLIVVLLIVVLLPAAPAPAATSNPGKPFVQIKLEPATNNGLDATIESGSSGVTLSITDVSIHDSSVSESYTSYNVEGEGTSAGLEAQFGKLGSIDVSFKPIKTVYREEPPTGCTGKPSTAAEGLFTGEIEFNGELNYVRISSTRARGTMSISRLDQWRCRHSKGRTLTQRSRKFTASHQRERSEPEPEMAAFGAAWDCFCEFTAFSTAEPGEPRGSSFSAYRVEDQEGMTIERGVIAKAAASAFTFNHEAGTARLKPPPPFSGEGTFKRQANGPDRWQSSILIPLLGGEPLNLEAPAYGPVLRSKPF